MEKQRDKVYLFIILPPIIINLAVAILFIVLGDILNTIKHLAIAGVFSYMFYSFYIKS